MKAPSINLWQPIETAPKDATGIIAWLKNERFIDGGIVDVIHWPNCTKPDKKGADWITNWIGTPTHWMPCPGKPK